MSELVSLKRISEVSGYSEEEILEAFESWKGRINGIQIPYLLKETDGVKEYIFPLEEFMDVIGFRPKKTATPTVFKPEDVKVKARKPRTKKPKR